MQVLIGAVGVVVAIWVVRHQLSANRVALAGAEAARLRLRAELVQFVARAGDTFGEQYGGGRVNQAALDHSEREANLAHRALQEIELASVTNSAELLVLADIPEHVETVVAWFASARDGVHGRNPEAQLKSACLALWAAVRRLSDEADRLVAQSL